MKHVYGPECPECQFKLAQAHPELREWFNTRVKPGRPDAHISWAYRDKKSQDAAVLDGKSADTFPKSKHNAMDENGQPCSDALDLFQQDEQGRGVWSYFWCKEIAEQSEKAGDPIVWGGNFRNAAAKRRGDYDHFERKSSTWPRLAKDVH